MTFIARMTAIALAMAAAGCASSTVVTEHASPTGAATPWTNRACLSNDTTSSGPCTGIAYSVPRQLLKVVFTRVTKTAEDLAKALAAANQDLADAKALLATRKAKEPLCPDSDTRQICADRRADIATATGLVKKAEAAATLAKQNAAGATGGQWTDTITVSALPTEPDPDHRFFARLRHGYFRDDVWSLATTKEGLLTSAKAQPTDRTADVLLQVARLATTLATGIPKPSGGGMKSNGWDARDRQNSCAGYDKLSLEFVVDVADMKNWKAIAGAPASGHYRGPRDVDGTSIDGVLKAYCSKLQIGIRRDWNIAMQSPAFGTADIRLPQAGLVYRRPLPYDVAIFTPRDHAAETDAAPPAELTPAQETIMEANFDTVRAKLGKAEAAGALLSALDALEESDRNTLLLELASHDALDLQTLARDVAEHGEPALLAAMDATPLLAQQRQTVLLPNEAPFEVVALPSGSLIAMDQTLAFDDGYPKQLDVKHGSEALAYASFPLNLIGAIIDVIPGGLVKLRIDIDSAKAAEIKAHDDLNAAEIARLQSDADLAKARSDAAAAAAAAVAATPAP